MLQTKPNLLPSLMRAVRKPAPTSLAGPTVNRSQIGLVAVGLSNSSLPPDTALGNFTQVTIYTRTSSESRRWVNDLS